MNRTFPPRARNSSPLRPSFARRGKAGHFLPRTGRYADLLSAGPTITAEDAKRLAGFQPRRSYLSVAIRAAYPFCSFDWRKKA